MATKLLSTKASQSVGVLLVILVLAVPGSNPVFAADLPLRIKPPVAREAPTTTERQRRLFEEFLLWLRSRPLP